MEKKKERQMHLHNGKPFLSVPFTTIPSLVKKSSGNGRGLGDNKPLIIFSRI